jgi:hypothetical protein
MRVANRKAKSERESRFSALEAYANLGGKPEDWKRFRLKYPDLFPSELTDWLYESAESFYKKMKDSPGARAAVKSPLLFYSSILRLVWSLNDPTGANLRFLYGFEKEVGASKTGAVLIMPGLFHGKTITPHIPGQSGNEDEQTTVAGLPPGKPVVNGITGAIDWEFGCAFQQSVYELMQQRWRTMVCPECGKFFLADKPNQKFCSTACFGEVKRKRALGYYHAKGSEDRKLKAAKEKGKSQ